MGLAPHDQALRPDEGAAYARRRERIRLGTCSLLPPTSMTASAIAFSPEIDIYLAVANVMLKALRENAQSRRHLAEPPVGELKPGAAASAVKRRRRA